MSKNEAAKKKSNMKILIPPLMLVAIIATILAATVIFDLGVYYEMLRNWLDGLGWLGPFAFILIYILFSLAGLPGSLLMLLAGPLFGSVVGVITVSIGSTLGAAICFLIARYFARSTVEKWASKYETFNRLDKISEEQGMWFVAILRLVWIIPYNFLNYALGLTKVKFRTYVFWSWLSMLPWTILHVVGGDVLTRLVTKGEISWISILFLILIGAFMVFVVLKARASLKKGDSNDEGAASKPIEKEGSKKKASAD